MKFVPNVRKKLRDKHPVILGCIYLCIVFMVFYGLYSSYQYAMMESINTLSLDFVHRVNCTARSAENVLKNLASQVFSMRSVLRLRTYPTISNSEMIDGLRLLNDFTASSTVVDSIYIYNGKQDYIYSTLSFGAVSDYASSFKDADAVRLIKNRAPSDRMIPIPRISEAASSTTNQEMVSILVFDVSVDSQNADNAMMLNISSEWFSELYFGEDLDTVAFIVDADGDLLFRSPGTSIDACEHILAHLLEEEELSSDNGFLVFDLENGEEELCFFSSMPERSWTYIHTVPYAKYLSGLSGMQSKAYMFFSCVFLIGAVASIILSYRVIFPFRTIQDKLSAHMQDASGDPIAQLNELVRRSADSTHIKSALRAMLREEALRSLLMGYDQTEGTAAASEHLALLAGKAITPMLVSSIRVQPMLDIIRPLCPHCEGVTLNGDHTVLLLQPDTPDILTSICDKLLSILPGRHIFIAVPAQNEQDLRELYNQLYQFYKLHFLYPDQNVRYITRDMVLEDYSVANEAFIERIIAALKTGNLESAQKEYAAFITALPGKDYRSVYTALTQLARSVLKLYYEHFPDAQPDYKAARAQFDASLITISRISDLQSVFFSWFTEITEHIRHERRSKQSQMLDDIVALIHSRYQDPTLSAQFLADTIGMSSAYLSRIFKQAQGVSISDYINQLRIEEAKRLLTHTDIKVMDLGEKLGVENMQYFFVRFKQATGLTPRQYRLQFRPENKES